jgi:hypothetical protein
MSDLFERLKSALDGRYELESVIGSGGMAIVFASAACFAFTVAVL